MAEIYVTSTADSGAGSLRQTIADALALLMFLSVFIDGAVGYYLESKKND